MRLNIEWIAPWIIGKPLKNWMIHWWHIKKGIVQDESEVGFTLIGLYVTLTKDALWSGASLSINLWGRPKPKLFCAPVNKGKCRTCGEEKAIVYDGECETCSYSAYSFIMKAP